MVALYPRMTPSMESARGGGGEKEEEESRGELPIRDTGGNHPRHPLNEAALSIEYIRGEN